VECVLVASSSSRGANLTTEVLGVTDRQAVRRLAGDPSIRKSDGSGCDRIGTLEPAESDRVELGWQVESAVDVK
jgi:hypothetical protein